MPPFSKLSRARFAAAERSPRERASDRSSPDASMPMLEALVCEVHSAALLTATIASAINCLPARWRCAASRLKPYIPGEPAIVSVLRNGMLETDLNEDTVRLVIQFFDDLGAGAHRPRPLLRRRQPHRRGSRRDAAPR